MRWKPLAAVALMLTAGFGTATPAAAHRDGCHRWHSCPSDSGSYSCGDAGYACRYPTYDESQRGTIYDPTYEDYGFTDTGEPDYDYGYSDSCPTGGCFTGGGSSGGGSSGGGSSSARSSGGGSSSARSSAGGDGGPVGSLVPYTPASTSTPEEAVNWGPWIFWGVVIVGGFAWFGRRSTAVATRTTARSAATTPRPTTSRPATHPAPVAKRSPRVSLCTCGGKMVVRTRRADGHKFLGCSRYPKCRRTRNL